MLHLILIQRKVAEKRVFSRGCKSGQFAVAAGFMESCAKISKSLRPGGRSVVNCHTSK